MRDAVPDSVTEILPNLPQVSSGERLKLGSQSLLLRELSPLQVKISHQYSRVHLFEPVTVRRFITKDKRARCIRSSVEIMSACIDQNALIKTLYFPTVSFDRSIVNDCTIWSRAYDSWERWPQILCATVHLARFMNHGFTIGLHKATIYNLLPDLSIKSYKRLGLTNVGLAKAGNLRLVFDYFELRDQGARSI